MLHPVRLNESKGYSYWFDGEGLEKLRSRDKLFKAFKKTRLNINKELYKKAKYDTLKLIAAKKQPSFMKNSQKVLANQRIMEHPDISWYAQENGCFKLQCNW